ncbi:hypothetical protein AAFC00_000967 [Neodothiora populina]|uniref:Btz domain-containing protein n=1 Tax=Neodothiora populina TaxID=2781224 RepID=A0ABR3PME3_9PEZI
MAPGRSTKTLVSRRRRTKGDEEDEEEDEDDDSVTMVDDTQSELSAASDVDEATEADADAEASDMSDSDTSGHVHRDSTLGGNSTMRENGEGANGARSKKRRKARKNREQGLAPDMATKSAEASAGSHLQSNGAATTGSTRVEGEGAHTEETEGGVAQDSSRPDNQAGSGRRGVTVADKRRREHEEYKKKRDSDPTFIPNRGGFFMHDARIPEQRGFSQFGRGRGRGRGFAGAPFAPGPQIAPPESAADANWKHDLHETINEPATSSKPSDNRYDAVTPIDPASKGGYGPSRPLNFSKSTQIGKVQIRVLLPSAAAPILFSDVPVKSHARLPDHRPPLRRDKPVRISLPDTPPRYQFPSGERSFIFIPRAMRPNQQGFGRARGSFGAYAGPASRRTSMYGGSVYTPSVSMSRRSSLAREIPRDSAFSPAGSYAGRPSAQSNRPVVRLPHAASHPPSNASPAGSVTAFGQGQSYPLPQKPEYEHWAEPATMYQPRPQKTISVTGIESPAGLALHAPQQQDQQPFHSQLPRNMGSESGMTMVQQSADPTQPAYYAPPYLYPGAASTGTPLSNIPERAIHAQPFQPVPAFYPQYPAQGYYYPAQAPQYPPEPAYAPPTQPGFAPAAVNAAPGAGVVADPNQAPPGTVAFESNGMVYYQDAAQVPQYSPQEGFYQAPVYGMGGMMTPGPEGNYYYPQAVAGPLYYSQS